MVGVSDWREVGVVNSNGHDIQKSLSIHIGEVMYLSSSTQRDLGHLEKQPSPELLLGVTAHYLRLWREEVEFRDNKSLAFRL